jgi:hypothetical protein
MKKSLLPLLSLFLMINVYSQYDFQEGYIITNNKDTIKGLIDKNSNNFENCRFKENDQSPVQNFLPYEIFAFRITNGGYFISKNILIKKSYVIYKESVRVNNSTGKTEYSFKAEDTTTVRKNVFLEYLLFGIIKIYYYHEKVNNYYFMEKDAMVDITPNIYRQVLGRYSYDEESNNSKGKLIAMMGDCPQIIGNLNNSSISAENLVKIGKKYHNLMCKDYSCVDYHRQKRPTKVFPCFSAGIGYSRIIFKSSDIISTDISREEKYVFTDFTGLNLSTSVVLKNIVSTQNRRSWKMGLNFGIDNYKCNFNGNFNEYDFGSSASSMTCKSFNIEYDVLFIQNFNTKIKSPFVEFGLCGQLSYNKSKLLLQNTIYDNKIIKEFTKDDFGLIIGGGYEFPVNQEKNRIILELNYKQMLIQSHVNLIIGYVL